jgi:hypothetical protein
MTNHRQRRHKVMIHEPPHTPEAAGVVVTHAQGRCFADRYYSQYSLGISYTDGNDTKVVRPISFSLRNAPEVGGKLRVLDFQNKIVRGVRGLG